MTEVDIPAAVAAHVLWRAGAEGGYPPGDFTSRLLHAWDIADPGNAAALAAGFPAYAAALAQLGRPGGLRRLRAAARGEHPQD